MSAVASSDVTDTATQAIAGIADRNPDSTFASRFMTGSAGSN